MISKKFLQEQKNILVREMTALFMPAFRKKILAKQIELVNKQLKAF